MDLVRLYINGDYNVQFTVSPVLIILFLLGYLAYLIHSRNFHTRSFEIDETEIGIGSLKVTLKPNHEDIQIAYKLWVELKTRKIGLPIDFDNDVIVEVYNSWYEFFRITRELIKDIPAQKIRRSESTQRLVGVAIDVLNSGMRPHLTRWQARFRRWYKAESEKDENKHVHPQELQARFEQYDSLAKDMKKVNSKLIKYRDKLEEIAMGVRREK